MVLTYNKKQIVLALAFDNVHQDEAAIAGLLPSTRLVISDLLC